MTDLGYLIFAVGLGVFAASMFLIVCFKIEDGVRAIGWWCGRRAREARLAEYRAEYIRYRPYKKLETGE